MSTTRHPPRRTSRPTRPSPHSGEGRQLGLDDRDIPGGETHYINPETAAAKPRVPARPEFSELNTHGVEPTHTELDRPAAGKIIAPKTEILPPEESAVPVYNVERPGKVRMIRTAIADSITITTAAEGDPVRLCSKDAQRVEILLLNEDPVNDIRWAEDPTKLDDPVHGGSLLWHGTNSYTKIPTQDELWAIAPVANAILSVVLITEVPE